MSRLVEEYISMNHDKAYATLAKISKACEYNYTTYGRVELRDKRKSCKEICQKVLECSPVYFTTIFRNLLQDGGNIDYQIPTDSPVKLHTPKILGYTALHFAVSNENCVALSALLKLGADTTMQSFDGFTALRLACERSYEKGAKCFKLRGRMEHLMADLFLDAQVKARATANPKCKAGISHLHIACMFDHARAVEFLIENGAYVNERVNSNSEVLPGYTPLHFTARYCSVEAIKVLLARGADPHVKDAKGSTPLHLLLDYGMRITLLSQEQLEENNCLQTDLQKVELALQLLTSHAKSPRASLDDKGLTRFHVDCTNAKVSVNENLLGDINAAIDLDSPFCPGYTPLHFAAHFNLRTFVALLEHGADVSAKDANGVTPLDICVRKYGVDGLREVLTLSVDSLTKVRFCNGDKLADVIASEAAFIEYVKTVNDKNVRISVDSPVWPGCNLLHIAVYLAKFPRSDEEILNEIDHSWRPQRETGRERMSRLNDVDRRVLACLDHRIDATAQDSDGASPLHLAFRQRKEAIVIKIICLGLCDAVDPVDRHGLSHLHIMACTEDCIILMACNFSPTYVNHQVRSEFSYRGHRFAAGSTALHMAAIVESSYYTVDYLLANDADLSIKNAEGLSSAHLSALTSSRFPNTAAHLMMHPKFLQENSIADGGFSNLHAACYNSNLRAIKSLVELGADVNLPITRDYREYANDLEIGYTPLHVAVARGTIEVVEYLVGHGANAAARSTTGLSPVLLAMKIKNEGYKLRPDIHEVEKILSCFLDLLQDLDAECIEDETGLTLLHLACSCLNLEMVEQLINRGSNVNARIDDASPALAGYTPLHVMCGHKSWEAITIARLLLDDGADVTLFNAERETPAHIIYSKVNGIHIHHDLLGMLLEQQTSYEMNPIDRKGVSHLHLACLVDRPDIVEALLRDGADASIATDYFTDKDAGCTPLHCEIKWSREILTEILVRYGADVNAGDAIGTTPLHLALEYGPKTASLEALLRCDKIDVNVMTLFGERPLELMHCYSGVEQYLKLCLSQGGLVNVYHPVTSEGLLGKLMQNVGDQFSDVPMKVLLEEASDLDAVCSATGRNAIHNIVSVRFCMSRCRYELAIGELTKRGIELDLQDKLGKTPLHLAVEFRNEAGVQALLFVGADVSITDRGGRTAFDCNENSREPSGNISRLFEDHKRKLILLLNLEGSDANRRLFKLGESCRDPDESHSLKMAELLLEFLTEVARIYYPTMSWKKREAIAKFLCTKEQSYLLNAGYLGNDLQLREAKKRVAMVKAVMEVTELLAGCPMPGLRTKNLMRFLRNSDLDTLMKLL